MKLICSGLFLLLHLCVFAQLDDTPSKKQFDIVSSLSINNDFNGDDWYLGFSAGAEDLGYEWGARLGFNFRPFYKKVQVRDANDIIRQYREQKYILSLDLDKRFLHFDFIDFQLQFFAGVRTGFLFGNYKGTQINSKTYGILAPMGGVCLNFNNRLMIKAGYMHLNDRISNVSDSRATITLLFPF